MLEKKSIEELDNLVKLEEFISYANTFKKTTSDPQQLNKQLSIIFTII